MNNLFDEAILIKKIRKNTFLYKYRNGIISISGQKYIGYSVTDAIRKFRKDFPR